MSLFKRMRDMTAATFNDMLERSEDPIKLIDQYLNQRQELIVETERLYRQVVGHAQSMRQQMLTAEQMRDKRDHQAVIALKAGEEEVARLALQEKLMQEEKVEQYRSLYEESKRSILELEEQLEQIRKDYREVKEKRQFYTARMESLRLQRKLNERAQWYGGGSGSGLFGKLEDRIHDMELEARALSDVRKIGGVLKETGYRIQEQLDKELDVLRRKLEREGLLKP